MTRRGGKAESTKERRAGRIGRKQRILQMKEKGKDPRRTQLERSSHPETSCWGRIEECKVAELHVTTEMCEHRFSFRLPLRQYMKKVSLLVGIHKLSGSFS